MIVEESPETGAVDVDVGAPFEEVKPGHAAPSVTATTVGEIGIGIGTKRGPWGRSKAWVPIAALPVWCFGLLHTDKNVSSVIEIILVERTVLDSRPMKPSSCSRLYQHPSASRKSLIVPAIEIMISRPSPHILNISRGRRRQVCHHETSFARCRCPTTICLNL